MLLGIMCVLAPLFCFAQVSGMRTEASLFAALKACRSDTGRVRVLLELADDYYFRPQSKDQEDSALVFLRQARVLDKPYHNTVLEDHMDILQVRMDTGQNDARAVYLPLIKRCQGNGDRENERFAWELLGDVTDLGAGVANGAGGLAGSTAETKIGYYQQAQSLAHQLGDIEGELRAFHSIADVHIQQKKFEQGAAELRSIVDNPRATQENLQFCYDLLGEQYSERGNYDSALGYALKVDSLMEITGDSVYTISYTGRLSGLYLVLGKPQSALEWCLKGLDHAVRWNARGMVFPVGNSTFTCYMRMGQPQQALNFMESLTKRFKPASVEDRRLVLTDIANAFTGLHLFDSAERKYRELIRLGDDNRNTYSPVAKARDDFTIGNFYFKKGAYAESKKYLDSALVEYERMKRVDLIAEGHRFLFRTDSALGLYVPAIQHLRAFQQYNDSTFSVSRSKQIEQLRIAFETEKKEKALAQLQEKEKVDQLQLQHAKAFRNWIIAASCMLLIIAGLLYRQNRLRRKNSKMIMGKNLLLEKLVTEKEWLLKEVHHRVKNNLQTVICLLESQSAYLENDALKAIENSKHRIYAMSLIHQKLYRSEGIRTIDMSLYIGEFAHYLAEGFGRSGVRILQEVEPLELGVSQAIPVGLIVNEAVTNCFKYAFPGGSAGKISVRLWLAGDAVNLVIADDGIGLASAALDGEVNSLGVELMRGLARDLKGTFSLKADHGVTVALCFPLDKFDVTPREAFEGAFAGI